MGRTMWIVMWEILNTKGLATYVVRTKDFKHGCFGHFHILNICNDTPIVCLTIITSNRLLSKAGHQCSLNLAGVTRVNDIFI